jgi:hypothetical protein
MKITSKRQLTAATAMNEAVAWLDQREVNYQHLPPYQLKVGPVNFWPGRGSITLDGESRRRPVKGLAGLEATLLAMGLLDNRPRAVSGKVTVIRLGLPEIH